MGHMTESAPSVQRSFRLSKRTLELLDAAAAASSESRNALADRLLNEAVRTEVHPLIRFRTGGAGRRQPMLVGTRLYIHQVIATLRGEGGDVEATAEYFSIRPEQVNAALAYYADFKDEVDADAEVARLIEETEHARWERQQRALE
jgi:uncharacterized protein (DUF433 family)